MAVSDIVTGRHHHSPSTEAVGARISLRDEMIYR
jgi:hypothetical protein